MAAAMTYAHPIWIDANTQMITVSGPITGTNVITEILSSILNTDGFILNSLYTQVIQASAPANTAQSLLIASRTAPTNFANKTQAFPLYRTYQDEKQSPQALGGFAPMNVCNVRIPPSWGIWQVLTVVGDNLIRNNVRIGFVFL